MVLVEHAPYVAQNRRVFASVQEAAAYVAEVMKTGVTRQDVNVVSLTESHNGLTGRRIA